MWNDNVTKQKEQVIKMKKTFKIYTQWKIYEIPTGHKNMPKSKIFKHKNEKRLAMKTKREWSENN